MLVQGIDKKISPTIVCLLSKLIRRNSSVPTVVAFNAMFNGKRVDPTSSEALMGKNSSHIGNILYKDITYDGLAMWLVKNEINMIIDDTKILEDINVWNVTNINGVRCYSLSLNSKMISSDKSNWLKLPSTDEFGITHNGIPFDLGGECDSWEIELLFCPRKDIERLPVEFLTCKLYDSYWLTVAGCVSAIAQLTWKTNELDSTKEDINIEFKVSNKLESFLLRDFNDLTKLFSKES